jgi:hypothetical protein
LRDSGVTDKIHHQAILTADFARQKIDERLLKAPGAGVFIIQFYDFLESQLAQNLSDEFGILDGAWNFRREQIVFDADDYAPGFVVEPFRFPKLGLGWRKAQHNAEEKRQKA